MTKSVWHKAAETLANRSNSVYGDYSCYHLGRVACDEFHVTYYRELFRPFGEDDWWNVLHKTNEELLAASLALLFMEEICKETNF